LVVTESTKKNGKKPTICLNMIVKNESKIIVSTLNNLAKYIDFDYWVISDTGSTDHTQQIIQDYFLEKGIPGELVTHEWRDFGYNRTKALEAAYDKTDYLLIFDADDQLHGDFKLPFLDGSKTKYADRYMLKIGKGFEYVRPLLINNRKRWQFKGVLHEYLSELETVCGDATVEGDYHIESGRTGNRSQNPTKYYDDAIILKNAYFKELALPDKGMSGRYAFYCGRSYHDAGEKYRDEAIEWYKKVLDIPNHWHQEKYYAALEIGILYKDKKQMDLAVQYLVKTMEYDMERIEGLIVAIEYFYQTGQYILVNALYHRFKGYNRQPPQKLFINMHLYRDRLEFFNGISAHFVDDKLSGYQCCKQVLINQLLWPNELTVTLNNLLCYRELMEKDDTLKLFQVVDEMFYKNNDLANNKNAVEVWNLLLKQNRAKFTTLNKPVIKNIQKALSVSNTISVSNSSNAEKILITFTTCKRLDLFKETLHSLLNNWLDLERITHWFCVDDNSSKEDRHYMKSTYPWLDYYMKTPEEKGHRESMNIIWAKLHTLKPTFWIHMEDDFLFHHQMDYIKPAIAFLTKNNHNVKQIVFNRNYAETIEHYNSKGHLPTGVADIVLHDHRPHDQIKNYMNSHYWPHYSFRPAMTLVKPILLLGNYDSANQFFERDYANRWNEAGYKTAFFDRVTHRHIGRLTSEINTGVVKNAYELNGESQFQAINKAHVSNIKVVNLERRADRKLDVIQLFKTAKLTDFMFYKATDGQKLESTNELKKLFQGNDFGNRRGVIGCALSHLQLWKELVEDKNYTYYVIFEDDIRVSLNNDISQNNFKERLTKLKPEMEKQEVLFLGYHMFSHKREEVKHIYDAEATEPKVEPLNKNLYIGGTFAYTINKIGAQKLIAYITENGIKHGIDYLMKIATGLNIQELQPLLVWSDWYEDKGKPIDTDIQANYDSLDFNKTLENEFEFKPQLDQIGNDIYFQPGTLVEHMSKALKDPACVGFNTLGFFKNKIETLTSSQYFREKDGIYIKKSALATPIDKNENKIRLKMLCNWCDSAQLCNEWSNMYMTAKGWKNIQMTSSSDPGEIDYYVIINSPPPNQHYVPEKTIVFQMEPWIADPAKNWGVKTWGEWATPDPTKFFKVFTHKTHLNNVQWQIDYPFSSKPVLQIKQDKIAAICSQKNFDKGHLLRNNFIRFIETMTDEEIEIYGRENYHNFKSYKGVVPDDNKYNVYAFYKYVLAVENNSEPNYATEKIWEGILCESLCFYWGCPNLEEYLDPQAFVRLPLEDPIAALKIIQQAIAEDWWSQRIGVIKQMKEKILNELGFFPLVSSLFKNQ
jgi:GR25 family glycosyltransferase involved in LPS biosynthesis